VVECLSCAVPLGVREEVATIFSHGLALEFVRQIWAHAGEDGDANAAHALHDAVTREPSCPGLTHQARAVLGLTACARWGGGLGPADRTLRDNLRMLVEARDPRASFWAEYIGVAAAVMATLVPARPRSPDAIAGMIRYGCSLQGLSHFADNMLVMNAVLIGKLPIIDSRPPWNRARRSRK
jgi:retrograde regulation protein 2